MYRTKIYTASKLHHRSLWHRHRALWRNHLEFNARWLDQPDGPGHNNSFWSEQDKIRHWIFDIQDVQRSDCLIAYRTPEDSLSGTLVEIGTAIGLGKMVYAVGFSDSDSWQSHPLVFAINTLDNAFHLITGDNPS